MTYTAIANQQIRVNNLFGKLTTPALLYVSV